MLAWTRFFFLLFALEMSHFHQSACGSVMSPDQNDFILTTNEIDITLKKKKKRR